MRNLFFSNATLQPLYNAENQILVVEGLLGTFYFNFKKDIQVKMGVNELSMSSLTNTNFQYLQTYYQIIQHRCFGLVRGFKRYVNIRGLGYRTRKRKNWILFKLGYSHLIRFRIPQGIRLKRIKKNKIKAISIDWQLLKQTVAVIRAFKEPDPYKGKGIRYKGENFKLKLGKRSKK